MTKLKPIITIIIISSFAIIAFWFGEAGKGIFQIVPYLVGVIGCAITALVCSNKKVLRLLGGGIFISVYVFSYYLGDVSFYSAYGNCADDAEKVRFQLQDYYEQKGVYPNSLDQLNIQLPCQRYIRGSILEYNLTQSGYTLSFRDWLIEHTATESETFIGHK